MNGYSPVRFFQIASVRFAAIYVVVFAGSALALGITVYVQALSALRQQTEARVENEATFLQEEYRSGGLPRLIDTVRMRGRGVNALDYLVQARDGTYLVGEMPAVGTLHEGWTFIDVPQTTEDGGRPERVHAFVIALPNGPWLAVGTDVRQVEDLEEAIIAAFVWTVGLAALLGVTGGILLSRTFLKRVDAISRTAEAIIGGDMSRRVPVRGTGDDLDRLAGTLNRMLERIAALMASLKQAGTDVAHDLRTPLARLYQRLDEARSHGATTDDLKAAIDDALREADGILDTFAALLRIAQIEGTSPREGFRRIDLSECISTVVDAYRPAAEDGGYTVEADITAHIVVWADAELLTQAFSNLVENALRHTPAGTRIVVRLGRQASYGPQLTIEDNGPGVEPAALPRLADRFFRSDRSRTTPGNGLGLSLSKAIFELHTAELRIEDAQPGLRIIVSWPPWGAMRATPDTANPD